MKFLKTNIAVITSFIGVYLFVTAGSWFLFSYVGGDSKGPGSPVANVSEGRSRIDPSLPKDQECPTNGKMFTAPERAIWEKRRPMTVVIENHLDSRPQSGLAHADIVHEVVAEGGITRFLAVFYCGASAEDLKIGPVRSARVYLINWASEYGKSPLFVHVGGANNICKNCPGGVKPAGQTAREVDAFRLLDTIGWRGSKGNAFDGGTNVGYPIMIRDVNRLGRDVAWEHTFVGFTDKIYDEAEKRGYGATTEDGKLWNQNFVKWKFADNNPLPSAKAKNISFEFWSNKSDYDVSWQYDEASNTYLRSNGGKEHVDWETKETLGVKNVVVMELPERGPVDKEGHMFYQNVGTGKMTVFQNGDVIKGTWEKKTQFDRTRFIDTSGREITFVRGEIWIEGIPSGNTVTYN